MPWSRALAPCALLLLAGPAEAQKTSLAIVELAAPQRLSGISARLAAEIVAAAAKEPYEVVEPAEASSRLGSDMLQKLRDCGGNGGCFSTYGAVLKTARAVVGSLDRTESTYLVKLWLVDLEAGKVLSSIDRSVLIASRRLNSDIAAAIPAFLQGKAEALGKLVIKANAPGAKVVLDGEEVGKTPLSLDAKPGKHTLKVVAESYLPIERFVAVEPGKTEELSVALVLVPGARPPEDPLMAKRARQADAFSLPTGSWIAGGVAVAATGVGVIFGLTAKSLQDKAGASSPYAITRQEALRGKRDALIANLCYAGAGASAIAAVVFAVAAPRGQAPAAAVVPLHGGAAVALGGAF